MATPTGTRIPGYRFKDGRLLVFEPERITLVRVWPEPEAAEKIRDGRWRPIHPEFRLVRPYRRRAEKKVPPRRQQLLPLALPPEQPTRGELADQKRRAFDALRFSLPPKFAAAIERFESGQFAMLRVYARTPEFLDLLVSNPALAFVLADDLGRRHARPDEQRILCSKQAALVAQAAFPAGAKVARTLRKVVPESINAGSMLQLREALRDTAAAARLGHLRKINAGVLKLLGSDRLRAVSAPALLEEVAQSAREKYQPATGHLLEDVLAFEEELRGGVRRLRFDSVQRVRRAHDALAAEYIAINERGILDCRFPPPPIRGTETIVPLTEPRALIVEGVRQKNCVASYAHSVARGDTFIYRVLAPERATLAIRPAEGGAWYVSELLAACNEDVSAATARAVRRWLEERCVSA
jgi:hypothetical protein